MTEYCRVSEELIIYNPGTHTCLPKPNTKKYTRLVREFVVRNSSVGVFTIQQVDAGEAVLAVILKRHGEELCNLSTTT